MMEHVEVHWLATQLHILHFSNPIPANKIKRPAPYGGKSHLEDYLVQCEMISEINLWKEQTKGT